MRTIIAILVAAIAIALTIAVLLGIFFLIFIGGLFMWNWIGGRKHSTPGETQSTSTPSHQRKRPEHTDAVTAIAYDPTGDWIISASRDRTLHVRGQKWEESERISPAFYPGPIAVGYHQDNGMRFAVGRFVREDTDPAAEPDIEVWDHADLSKRLFPLSVPHISRVLALAFGDNADELYALVSVHDSQTEERSHRLYVFLYDLRSEETAHRPQQFEIPGELPLYNDYEIAALSANGRYIACRTKNIDTNATTFHGVGVWDVYGGKWKHRFGWREAEPHKIYAVTKDGDTVFSGREDSPGRDYKFGGPEWYDGLYVWEAATALPEGTETSKPDRDMNGNRNMAFNSDETLFATPIGTPGEVEIYDLKQRKQTHRIRRPKLEGEHKYGVENVWCVAFSPDSQTLATGHADGKIWFWDLSDEANKM